MPWNWELPAGPYFIYDSKEILEKEGQFLLGVGEGIASLRALEEEEYRRFFIEIFTPEGFESSKIEGEILDRESLQSSICKQFGFDGRTKSPEGQEAGMAELLFNAYETYDKPLTHEMLWNWHQLLFQKNPHITDLEKYRSHEDPMQIVSN